jgi:hypothetical protein
MDGWMSGCMAGWLDGGFLELEEGFSFVIKPLD